MTRVNVVPVTELSDGHLEIEHYELPRVFVLVRGAIERGEAPDDWRNPSEYRVGAGHVRFFYPRLLYVFQRQIDVMLEMLVRGLPLIREEQHVSDISSIWLNDYEPTEQAITDNRKRLSERSAEYEWQFTRR